MKQTITLMQQMFVVSDCLLALGYRQAAKLAQDSNYWEFAREFTSVAIDEATTRKDYATLGKLSAAGLYQGGF